MFYDYNSFFFVISPSKNEIFGEFSEILESFGRILAISKKNFRAFFGKFWKES